jgi:hypothetical protein
MGGAVDRILPGATVPTATERVPSLDPVLRDDICVRLAITLLWPHESRHMPGRQTIG